MNFVRICRADKQITIRHIQAECVVTHNYYCAKFPDDGPRQRSEFAKLIVFFGELIRLDVFSHDKYMRTLISRGDLDISANAGASTSVGAMAAATHQSTNLSNLPLAGFGLSGPLDAKRPKMEVSCWSLPSSFMYFSEF